jgi:hypothetical protein
LKLHVIYDKVLVALMEFSLYPFSGFHVNGVSIGFFERGYEGFNVVEVYIMVIYKMIDFFQRGSFQMRKCIPEP